VLEANPVFLQVMGYTAAELAGKHHSAHFAERDRPFHVIVTDGGMLQE